MTTRMSTDVTAFNPGYSTMTDIGKEFGVSGKRIGRWLIDIGWRTPGNQPSLNAVREGLAKKVISSPNGKPFFAWNTIKTIEALKEAGHELKDDSPWN